MKPKEIHDLLLSLAIRLLGVWILFGLIESCYTLADRFEGILDGRYTHDVIPDIEAALVGIVVKVLLASYFMFGAPPFLRWATRDRS